MKSKEEFKNFVKQHPELIKYVKNENMSWQKFYELYSLYDEDNDVWKEFLKTDEEINVSINNTSSNINYGINDIFNMIKGVKPEVIQQNINSIQKFLGFIQEFVGDNDKIKTPTRNGYTPRPTRKMFED